MSVSNLFCASRRAAYGGESWIDLEWDPPADLVGSVVDFTGRRMMSTMAKAEAELKAGVPLAAIQLLQPESADLPDYGRRLLIEAARQINDLALLRDLLKRPHTIAELFESTDINIRNKFFQAAYLQLDEFGSALGVSEPDIRELRARIAAAEVMTI
jgi:hypothetical protein